MMYEFPSNQFPVEKIGEGDCLCGLPGCEGHPVVIEGSQQFVEFSADEYQYLLDDLQMRMRIANGEQL
jgi:hypothetical protein